MIPLELRYTKSHEWVRVEGEYATIGLTGFAIGLVGDLNFVDLPAPGQTLTAGEIFGSIESVKAVTDLYAPVSGEVVESNHLLGKNLAWLASDPYFQGWMVRVRLADPAVVNQFMTAGEYAAHCASA